MRTNTSYTEPQIVQVGGEFLDKFGDTVVCNGAKNYKNDNGNHYVYTGRYTTGPKAEAKRDFTFFYQDIKKIL